MQKKKIVISEKRSISKFFKNYGISEIEPLRFKYSNRKKIVVYTPFDNTDAVANAMFKAGGGVIGDYSMCSFRIAGTGTYKPGAGSNPHIGRKGKLSYAKEVRLEVECVEEVLDKVIDAMLKSHPYEEAAYEIYDFTKRENVSDGTVVTLSKAIKYPELILSINRKMSQTEADGIHKRKSFKKITVVEGREHERYITKSRLMKADAVIFVDKKINLIIL